MSVEILLALLAAELKDDVLGTVQKFDNGLVIVFGDGTVRKITVE